jgi:glycosyltransferase involved in cell wall biosynthesis/SAM-dependent methyltransferase
MPTNFYRAFEEKFRGPRELIKSRLRIYLPFLQPLQESFTPALAVDLGCGRGEWLELLNEVGFEAQGVDLDDGMLAACRELGLKVHTGDALAYLNALPDNSHAIVSGFHLAEHIPFRALQQLVAEALRVLKPGGLLILETPNPENLVVGTSNFYLDPTHQRPLPPPLLAFVPEHAGFKRTKVLRLQEADDLRNNPAPSLFGVLEGVSPDYAVVAQKDGPTGIYHALNAPFEVDYGLTLAVLAGRYQQLNEDRHTKAQSESQHLYQLVERTQSVAEHADTQARQAIVAAQQELARAERAEERANLSEGRAQQELARAERAEERANLSEGRAQQELARAERAEERANLAEGRAQQELARAVQAEERANQAEARAARAESREEDARSQAESAKAELLAHRHAAEQAQSRILEIERESAGTIAEIQTQAEISASRVSTAEEQAATLQTALQQKLVELNQTQKSNLHHYHLWLESQQQLQAVTQASLTHQHEILALRKSLSWRVTTPLRWLAQPVMQKSPKVVTRTKAPVLPNPNAPSKRIVIDMQGAQTESRFRGIGRYTMSFAQAVARNRGQHEVFLALSGMFPDTIEPIRAAFVGLLPQENIRVWHAPGPVREEDPGNDARRETAELLREAFLASLQPDVIHLCSLFEGYVDDAVTSVARFDTRTPVSVTLYDLIPLLNPDQYLKPNPRFEHYYLGKVSHLKQAAQLQAISEFTRCEGLINHIAAEESVGNVGTAIDRHFRPIKLDKSSRNALLRKLGLTHPFVLYTGGADERKNLPRLIQAYAALPSNLRNSHQLVLAGKMPQGNIAQLEQIADTAGMTSGELIFTGYVSDEELILLYNLCKLYVFPSWHEGFGLPALEAMACGAPVIGANTTSLPEVIGLDSALFDPLDITSIAAKLKKALTSYLFRARLRRHGLQQAKRFSWDETARRAIGMWEAIPSAGGLAYLECSMSGSRLVEKIKQHWGEIEFDQQQRLDQILLLNQQNGIERQLLMDVSELSQRDSATGVQRVVRSYLKWLLQSPPTGFRIEPVFATPTEGYRYARRFTQRYLGLDEGPAVDEPIRWQRGDIFFGLDMQHHVQLAHTAFYRQLRLEGVSVKFLVYDLLPIQLADLFKDSNAKDLHEQWLTMIAATDGAICISKATAGAFDAWIAESAAPPMPTFQNTWVHIGGDIEGSKPSQGLPADSQQVLAAIRSRTSFLCVSTLEPRKGQQMIVEALDALWEAGQNVNLVLVGQQGWKIEALADKIRQHPENGQRLFWLQGISDEYLEKVYTASTCLIAASINEGFGLSLIEAARHAVPIVARDIPVFREVAGDCAFYFSGDTAHDLASTLRVWLDLYQEGRHPKSGELRWSSWQESTEKLKIALAEENYPRRQLLVDISELVQRDARSGIQRVVRSILKEWLSHPPDGYRVEPVFATVAQGYRYARRFTHQFIGRPDDSLQDELVDYAPGDIFFGLDLQPQVQVAQRGFYKTMRRQGVRVQFVVYDLLCVLLPEHFLPGSADGFTPWLEVVAESDGAICISKAVADELNTWSKKNGSTHRRPFSIDWFHLGADVDNSAPTSGLLVDAESVLDILHNRTTFVTVGTLEPRKGHAQVLAAFEQLWQEGSDVNLVIVGKQGWMVETLVERLRTHPKLGKHLFWLEGISDEYLEKVYAASTCLISASYGEGFGLPLIEAAQHKLPIIARDIPVFREVAGEHAYYFDATSANELAEAIKTWMALYKAGQQPKSNTMPWLTWKESATRLGKIL